MKSRMTRLATAAVITVAVGLAIHFSGGSVDLTTIALGEITEAMQRQPWMHCISRGFQGGNSQNIKAWINFEAKVAGFIMEPGKTQFWDIMNEKKYEFDPETNTITIEYTDDKYLPAQMSSPAAAIETMYEGLRSLGADITTTLGEYDGQAVQIQEVILSSESSPSQTLVLYIEPQSKLILVAEVKATDPNGQVMASAEMTYSYPQSGPRSIYDLGVPRDVEVINKLPSEDYQSIWDSYRESRKIATKQYIAIFTSAERFPSDAITRVEVNYESGQKHRMENHSVFKPGEPFDKFWPQYKEQLGNTFDSLLAWAAKNYEQEKGILSVFVNDSQYSRHARRRGSGEWKLYKKSYSPGGLDMPVGSLGGLGWPQIGQNGTIIEDEYAKANNLICIERLQQGVIHAGTVSLPARFLFYIDPQKDYICVLKVAEWCPDAEWQEDKNWLEGVETENIPGGWIERHEITELSEAANSHWYPKVIVVKETGSRNDYKDAPLKVCSTKTIYLETNPQFPEDIFNIEKLPGQ